MKSAPLLILLFLLVSGTPLVVFAASTSDGAALSSIQNAFAQVSLAESKGANITLQVQELNQALQLVSQGEAIQQSNVTLASQYYSQAESIAAQVQQQIPQSIAQGQAAATLSLQELSAFLGVLALAGVLVYLFTGRVLWRLWLRQHRDWTVKRGE